MAGCTVSVGGALLKRGTVPHTFIISHFQGTNPVQYNVSGWLKACRENPVSRSAATMLQESKWYIRSLSTVVCKILVGRIVSQTRMWANAQRDGRHAKYRWCPLFNAARFG